MFLPNKMQRDNSLLLIPLPLVNPTTSQMLRILLYIQGQSSCLCFCPRKKLMWTRLAVSQKNCYLLGNAPKFTFSAFRVIKTKAEARLKAWTRSGADLLPCLTLGTGAVVMGIIGTRQQLNWLCQLLSITNEHVWSFIKPLIFQWIDWDWGQELPQIHPLVLSYWVPTGLLTGFPLVLIVLCLPTEGHSQTERDQSSTGIKKSVSASQAPLNFTADDGKLQTAALLLRRAVWNGQEQEGTITLCAK